MTHLFRGARRTVLAAATLALALLATATAPAAQAQTQARPTVEEARKLIEEAEKRLLELTIDAERASWLQSTYIIHDTEILAAEASEVLTAAGVEYAKAAARFDGVELPADLRRRMNLLKQTLTLAAPGDPAKTTELSRLAVGLESAYGAAKYCRKEGECLDLEQLSDIIEESRDPKELLDVWVGWHNTARPMRDDYIKLVTLANEGARELGYKDTGAMWRAKYDMEPDAFAREVDRLWGQVKPLYDALHCHVRAKLNETYGGELVPLDQPIPAHLLGNMWAQDWDEIYELVAPPAADPGYSLTELLEAKKVDAVEMTRYGERFFTSLGFAPLPETFWERSMLTKPRDREVVCHASAWSIDAKEDLRIKMCIQTNEEDFRTIHHELGHNFYQRAYNRLPFLYQDSANDGFHEAVGDTVALSITPEYLQQIGLIQQVPDPSKDLGLLMRQALDKVAFLPFGVMIDQWRWQVFSGQVKPSGYNQAWWDLREKYQGVRPPVARSEQDFDPGAKYHVPGNTPYTRYFLAAILQYQLHEGLCKAAGNKGPLHRCSIYGNKEAGQRLEKMLAMGLSRPWPEALEAVTGTRQMDGTAIVNYFAPLKSWLDQQNKGRTCGW
jgi:peptidyl-dipeptidase A